MQNIQYHSINASSFVDGPGKRVVLFTQGCPIHCKGCQNTHLWNPEDGHSASPLDIAVTMINLADGQGHSNFTISGGEPMSQLSGIAALAKIIKAFRPLSHIIVYTGYTWEYLREHERSDLDMLFSNIEILVDGPFVIEKDNDLLMYRGSANQRPIDVKKSISNPETPFVLDWTLPAIILPTDGDAIMPVGLAAYFEGIGTPAKTRMCGQTKGVK